MAAERELKLSVVRRYQAFLNFRGPDTNQGNRVRVRHTAAEVESTSSPFGTKYHVFLSFRGPDTRHGFTQVLYHALTDLGIRVFLDDEEIRKGEDIGEEILSAIQESKIFVPIFSRNYASSKWCLKELTKMFESKKALSGSNNKKKILPIFYDVGIDDVNLKTELYKEALSAHRQMSVPAETVENWEAALRDAGKLKGWELKNISPAEFATEFARGVSIQLKTKHKYLDEYLIRRDDQEDELMKLLDVESYGVRIVGIHGMGGIGKTTLAKVVHNKLCDGFDHSVFLSDIRESSQQYKGIEHLQNKLLIGMGLMSSEINDSDDGIRRIREVAARKKVLIVLDDVDHIKQIQSLVGGVSWFGSGSRIIITSRDKRVLQIGGVDIFEVTEMESEDALHLFSKHAFDKDCPPADYRGLSEKVVASTGGLPLALKVIGSYLLFHKSHKHWENTIKRLEKTPHGDVQKTLMISYEALHPKTKQIFLDIACFFINHDKINPTYMWEALGFDPNTGLKELVHLSLIKIIKEKGSSGETKKNLWMHDQLRDLGRNIVNDENFNVATRSRLFRPSDVSTALEKLEDDEDHKGNIEMMRLPFEFYSDRCIFTTRVISSFKKLRYLECYGANVFGDQRRHLLKSTRNFIRVSFGAKISSDHRLHLPELLWLSWGNCPRDFKRTDLCLNNLVILDLSHSSISETWGGWSHIQTGNQVKVLDLTSCESLTKMPDLSKYTSLERLILKDCYNLTNLDPSICKLKCLKFLNIQWCHSIKGFPEELCSLSSLEVIMGVDGSITLYTEVRRGFNMPESFGNLISLSIFRMDNVQINKLPKSIRMLVGLRHLSLSGCKGLQGLPDLLGDMVSLVELDLAGTDIISLPPSIERLKKLELLNLANCEELKMLPDAIGHLRSLVWLNLSGSGIKEIPSTINLLPHLSTLLLLSTRITGLPPKLPTSLTQLYVSTLEIGEYNLEHPKIEGMEGIGECHRLVNLDLDVTMSYLPKGLNSFSQLLSLTLRCSDLQSCPLLPPTLSFLRLEGLKGITKLPQLSNLKNLSKLYISGDPLEDDEIFGNMGIGELESLREFRFSCCDFRSLNVFFLPKCLVGLEITICRSLETVKGLSHLMSLKKLKLEHCDKLAEIGELGELDSLQSLYIRECDSLETIPNLIELRNLREVEVRVCKKFKGIDNIDKLGSQTYVGITACDCESVSRRFPH